MKGTFLAFLPLPGPGPGGAWGRQPTPWGPRAKGWRSPPAPPRDPAAAQGLVATQQAQYQPGEKPPQPVERRLAVGPHHPLGQPGSQPDGLHLPSGGPPAPNDRQGITLTFPHQQDLIFYGYGCTEAELRLGGTDADPGWPPLRRRGRAPRRGDPHRDGGPPPVPGLLPPPSDRQPGQPGDRLRLVGVPKPPRAQEAALQEAFQAFFAFPLPRTPAGPSPCPKRTGGGPEANAITQASIRPVGPDVALDCPLGPGGGRRLLHLRPPPGRPAGLPEVSQVPGGVRHLPPGPLGEPKGRLPGRPRQPGPGLPLDPQGAGGADLTLSADGQTLFLTTSQGEALTCAVVDTAGMTCRQTLSLPRRACTPSTGRDGTRADPATTDPAQLQPTVQLIPGRGSS